MAIYHFSGSVISRSQGRSVVACAAYRSASLLHDEHLDKTYNYTLKGDVVHTEILLPENAPQWMSERTTLWNAVEQNEKRKDAQLAREFNFALPKELSLEQNIELAREFVKTQFVRRGMVADLAIHNDHSPDGEAQPHAHVLLTMREVTPDGFGQKVREWNDKALLMEWRESWAGHANLALAKNGLDLQIDHRTLKEQGIDLEPQHKIGAVVAQARLARFADHARIAFENGERLLENPNIALEAITRQQSTFTQHDVVKFINRHTLDNDQFQAVYTKVMTSSELVLLGHDIKSKERYTTQSMLALENRMLYDAEALHLSLGHAVAATHSHAVLEAHALTEEQAAAFEHLTAAGDLKTLVGYAGTGKSYLLGAARETWEMAGYRVHGVTLSGIAAQNLEASSGIASRTLASRFYYWERGREKLSDKDVIVLDEAGMIGSRQIAVLAAEVKAAGAKLVLTGDTEQLQAIEAGAAFRAIHELTGDDIRLTHVIRQREDWQKQATMDFAATKTPEAIDAYDAHDHLHAFAHEAEAKEKVIDLWNDVRINQPDKTQIILAYTRKEVREFNELARTIKQANHELGEDHSIQTERGERQFSEGDRLYFLKNEKSLGVKNGTLGTIEKIQESLLSIRLDTQELITVNPDFYPHLDHGYAATIHKAQGVTVDYSYILASPHFDRHAIYVAMSRHRDSADLFYSQEKFTDKEQLLQTLSRERAKDIALDYIGQEFAERRNIDSAHSSMANKDKELEPEISPLTHGHDFEQRVQQRLKARGIETEMDVKAHPEEPIVKIAQFYATRLHELEKHIAEGQQVMENRRELYQLTHSLAQREDLAHFYEAHMPKVSQRIAQLNHEYTHRHELGIELTQGRTLSL